MAYKIDTVEQAWQAFVANRKPTTMGRFVTAKYITTVDQATG